MTEITREKTPAYALGTTYKRKVLWEHMGKRQDRVNELKKKIVSLFSLLDSDLFLNNMNT